MTSLVQLESPDGRGVALVDGAHLVLLAGIDRIYSLAIGAQVTGRTVKNLAESRATGSRLSYDDVYEGRSPYRLLAPVDHPSIASLLVTGTGLTHRASADNRSAMHAEGAQLTDSMKMYQWGSEGGRPAPGTVGVSPEWFYKGRGDVLNGPDASLDVPDFAEDGGEEGEIAGAYIIDNDGAPRRLGMTQGNEFSDHVVEKKNYLYLASSKMRKCAIGPELILDPAFEAVPGVARVRRGDSIVWEKPIRSGEQNMCHSLENMEHHHFKFPQHRVRGDIHVHFYGASAFSFGDKVKLEDGDVMEISFEGFGRPLRNPIAVYPGPEKLVSVRPL